MLETMQIYGRVLVGFSGLLLVLWTINTAIKTFIMPRSASPLLVRVIYISLYFLFNLRVRNASYSERDRIMAMFAPVLLFIMPFLMLVLILIGYMGVYWAIDRQPLFELFKLSGSSLLTLGYASVESPIFKLLEFSEAMLGLIIVALLIAYLPTMYSAFSRREATVALLESRASNPPSALEFIARTHRNSELDMLHEVWGTWQQWFAEVEESHTSLGPLSFFRSPKPNHSWVTAAGVVLDSAALILSSIDVPFEPKAAFFIRTGYIALNHIAEFFQVDYVLEPQKDDPISISRAEFDTVFETLQAQGVPMVADQDRAWRDFSGWRVNYDTSLLSLATLTMAPYAQWVSDRSVIPYNK